MYNPKIFLVGEGQDELITLEETGYVTEDVLQELLVKYPDLLPGDQINPENPRRWLLVAREMAVPDDTTEAGRWSLDHLFIDQDGIPTFVECKRATDTRNRREIVAQMLDYAANGVEYWNMDRLRQAAAETAQKHGKSLDAEIGNLLGSDEYDVVIEDYWALVQDNLQNRRVRLLFVSDRIPKELRRLVEFLNEEMHNVEVLAVEVKQFTGENQQGETALVPRLIGLTESARSSKESRPRRGKPITRAEFLEKCTPETRRFFQTVMENAEEHGHVVNWGGAGFSVRTRLPDGAGLATFAYCYPPDWFAFYFEPSLGLTEDQSSSLRRKLLDFGVFQESGKYTLQAHVTEDSLKQLDEVYSFILDTIHEYVKAGS